MGFSLVCSLLCDYALRISRRKPYLETGLVVPSSICLNLFGNVHLATADRALHLFPIKSDVSLILSFSLSLSLYRGATRTSLEGAASANYTLLPPFIVHSPRAHNHYSVFLKIIIIGSYASCTAKQKYLISNTNNKRFRNLNSSCLKHS